MAKNTRFLARNTLSEKREILIVNTYFSAILGCVTLVEIINTLR